MFGLRLRTSRRGSISGVNAVKALADFCLRPPVEEFGMLEFESIDRIIDRGCGYSREQIRLWEGMARGGGTA